MTLDMVAFAPTRVALALLDGTIYQCVDLMEAGRKGLFYWDGADLSAEVAADPEQGVYVAPALDASGASGAWVRQFDGAVKPNWWGIDPMGVTPAAAAFQAMLDTCVALGLEDIDARGQRVNLTGGTQIDVIADGARLRFLGGHFFSTDPSEINRLMRFVLCAEVAFIGSSIDRGYLGSTDIQDYSDTAHAVECRGVGEFRAERCKVTNVKGDAFYGGQDRPDSGGTDRSMGNVFWLNNNLYNIKRNFLALTSYTIAHIDGNVCTADPAYVWATSAAIDLEPNTGIKDLGYIRVSGNTIRATGVKSPIRWLTGSRIPTGLFESVIVSDNTIDCTGVYQAIYVDCALMLERLSITGNNIKCTMAASGATNPGGILINRLTGLCGIDNNVIEIGNAGADYGIYYTSSSSTGKATTNGNTIALKASGNFRGIRANVSSGAMITANDNVIFAVDSTLEAILLSGQAASKATTLTANGNGWTGFVGGTDVSVANAVKAMAIGNVGGTVSGSGNTAQTITNNLA